MQDGERNNSRHGPDRMANSLRQLLPCHKLEPSLWPLLWVRWSARSTPWECSCIWQPAPWGCVSSAGRPLCCRDGSGSGTSIRDTFHTLPSGCTRRARRRASLRFPGNLSHRSSRRSLINWKPLRIAGSRPTGEALRNKRYKSEEERQGKELYPVASISVVRGCVGVRLLNDGMKQVIPGCLGNRKR